MWTRIFATLFLLFHIVAHPVWAQKQQPRIFTIGVEDIAYYPLFDFSQDRLTFSRELLDAFAQQYNYQFDYLPLPIKRFERWLIEEKIDFKYPDNARWFANPKEANKFVFSDSTIKLIAGTSVLAKNIDKPTQNFKTIGTLLGFYPTTWIDEIESGEVTLHQDPSTTLLVRNLLTENLDGIDIEPSVINHQLKRLNAKQEVIIDRKYRYDVYDYHLSTIQHPQVIAEFNQFLRQNQDWIRSLIKKYQIVDYRPYLSPP